MYFKPPTHPTGSHPAGSHPAGSHPNLSPLPTLPHTPSFLPSSLLRQHVYDQHNPEPVHRNALSDAGSRKFIGMKNEGRSGEWMGFDRKILCLTIYRLDLFKEREGKDRRYEQSVLVARTNTTSMRRRRKRSMKKAKVFLHLILDIPPFRIESIECFHRFFVPNNPHISHITNDAKPTSQLPKGGEFHPNIHGKYNPSTQYQSCQPRHGAGPEREEAFVFEDFGCAGKAVLVFSSRFDGLHAMCDF